MNAIIVRRNFTRTMQKTINIQDIVEITSEELIYVDQSGTKQSISFEECKRNWIDYVNAGGFTDWGGKPAHLLLGESNCIGTRNMCDDPHILLFANEKVKIRFTKNKRFRRLTKLQKQLPAALLQAGVTTFDMT